MWQWHQPPTRLTVPSEHHALYAGSGCGYQARPYDQRVLRCIWILPNEVWCGHTLQTRFQASRVCRCFAVRKRRPLRDRGTARTSTLICRPCNHSPPECVMWRMNGSTLVHAARTSLYVRLAVPPRSTTPGHATSENQRGEESLR